METVINLFSDFGHLLNELVTGSKDLVESLGAVVYTLTEIAGVVSQAVDYLGSLLSNATPPM